MRSGFIFGVLLLCSQHLLHANSTPSVVINEIHCTPALKYQEAEFIEFFNYGEQAVSIGGWRVSGAVEYVVPENTILAAQSYFVLGQNENFLRDSLGLSNVLVGSFKGRLKKEGETIILRNELGKIIDKVSYKQSFPWPTVGGSKGYSHQLIYPTLDNALAGHWRGALPTPGNSNQTFHDNVNQVAPAIDKVKHIPQSPQSGMPVIIEAHVKDNQAVKIVQVLYQIVDAGKYIRRKDKNFEKTASWLPITMNDEGRDGDKVAGDGIYTVILPDSIQKHRRLIRYRIWAKDDQSNYVRVPYADDPKLNFAYFVYDGLPDYCNYEMDSLPQLPVCHLIANEKDINYYINRYFGNVYKTTGTVVYNGEVYDHIGFRSRGFKNRHKRTKRNIKINFNRGNPIEVIKDSGKPYKHKRDKLVLSGNWLERLPNTHGLAESVLYRMFTLQEKGQASYADYLHFRVIDSQTEQDTFGGDFWGIYLALENYDKDYIKSHKLPEGNIYSYKPFARRYMSSIGPYALKNDAYREWNSLFDKRNSEGWWREHVDLEAFYAFIIGQQVLNNRESGYRGQHWWTEYYDAVNKKWQIFPWDMDLMWIRSTGYSSVGSEIRRTAFSHQAIYTDYQNNLRNFLDLFYNEEEAYKLIEEEARLIYQKDQSYSWVNLDKLRWGHNYEDYEDQVQLLKRFVRKRRAYIIKNYLEDCPASPSIEYSGQETFPADGLSFRYSVPNVLSYKKLDSIQWRISRIDYPDNLDPNRNYKYELNAKWIGTFSSTDSLVHIPSERIKAHQYYSVRARIRNTDGYFSHWSEPIQFHTTPPVEPYGKGLTITEIMYKPSDSCGVEFIELQNQTKDSLDISRFRISGGVEYKFPKKAVLAPNTYLILTRDEEDFETTYNRTAFGEYKGKLSNKGEEIFVLDNFGSPIDSVSYSSKNKNLALANGEGFSLELYQNAPDNLDPRYWTVSDCPCGSPSSGHPFYTQLPIDNNQKSKVEYIKTTNYLPFSKYVKQQKQSIGKEKVVE